MNRVIKFRALKDDMSNCNFVYGQLVYDAVGITRITEVDKSGQGLLFHSCLKNTEGQFTGLTDKNGKEIYEGDIWKKESYPNHILEVIFKNGKYNIADYSMTKGKVIGNIHENPELLTPSLTKE